MTKERIVAILACALFLVGSSYAVAPLAAQIAAGRGDLALALRLDPLNDVWYAKKGEGFAKQAKASGNDAAWVSAEHAYWEAVRLCPLKSAYRIKLAEAWAHGLAKRGMVSEQEMDAYIENLVRAVECDPNYYFTNAAAGYYLLLFKPRLTESDRNFAIYCLRHALELNPDYRNEVFSYVANGLGDYKVLQQITPRSTWWQDALLDFLRDIDRWKYRAR